MAQSNAGPQSAPVASPVRARSGGGWRSIFRRSDTSVLLATIVLFVIFAVVTRLSDALQPLQCVAHGFALCLYCAWAGDRGRYWRHESFAGGHRRPFRRDRRLGHGHDGLESHSGYTAGPGCRHGGGLLQRLYHCALQSTPSSLRLPVCLSSSVSSPASRKVSPIQTFPRAMRGWGRVTCGASPTYSF